MSEQQTTRQQAQPEGDGTAPQDEGGAPGTGRQRRQVDVSELVWRTGNVVATVVRVVALLCAVILVAAIILRLVGTDPANVVVQFLAAASDVVVLGFRDMFRPADPTVFTLVNFGLAAVFWVLVGEFVSRLVRFLAARLA